ENLNVITFEDNQNHLFPNPFNHELNLKYPETIKSISFYDALGKKINSSFVYNSTVINTEFLKDGFYFCLITLINDSTEMIKLFKRSK
ncbi:T9SS type A sorting domain-containing protein, partial [Flavobacterium sp.]|uniref:T9SS type A sorting domain-containing protein n=1 Tax=Flavobacterium sp. TaxID=239 RepID=UPI0025B85744